MQMLEQGDESSALPIIQRCGEVYSTSKPLLSKIAKFKGLLSGLLGGGKCNNISPEYLEVIATEGGNEVVEVFRTNCPPSIFNRLKNKLKGKIRKFGSEIRYGIDRVRQGARDLKRDVEFGAHVLKEDIKKGVSGLAMQFEDLKSMNHFKLFGASSHECAALTPEQVYNAPNGFFRMMNRQCFMDLPPECMAAIPPPQIPRIKWWKYATAEKVASLPPESLMYLPFTRLGRKELRYSETKNYFEGGGGEDIGRGAGAAGIGDHPCLGIGEEQEEYLMRDRKVWRAYVHRCKAGSGPSRILIIILMMLFVMTLLGLLTVALFF